MIITIIVKQTTGIDDISIDRNTIKANIGNANKIHIDKDHIESINYNPRSDEYIIELINGWMDGLHDG